MPKSMYRAADEWMCGDHTPTRQWGGPTVRILLVEDDPRIVLFVGESLEDAGYSVTVARDGEEGLLDARLNDDDLVVLDLTLPVLDGLDVARRLRADEGDADPHAHRARPRGGQDRGARHGR